jgi:hypothetical protein
MMLRAWIWIGILGLLVPTALAQGWSQAYEKGLEAARAGNWAEARQYFKQAAAYRTEDVSGPTNLPGPATERRLWRAGASYSPNFLAAYSAYRLAASKSGDARYEDLRAAASELEALHAKNQFSPESFYLLNSIYTTLGDTEKRAKLDERFLTVRDKATFKVDQEPILPEDQAAVSQMMGQGSPQIIEAPALSTPGAIVTPGAGQPVLPGAIAGAGTRVPTIVTKYALLIGNAESRIPGAGVPFSAYDAQRVREALVMSAGYPEENVDLVVNGTAAQILASAKAMADRIPNGATVFVYFSGAGVNLDGKDYLAGVDTESPTDSSSMVAKNELYRLFMAKGAKMFCFFQAHRPTVRGRYFGMEVPLYGIVSQSQATMPGDMVFGYIRNGRTVGIFTDALVSTLSEFRSNQVPILEFGWQLFYRMRRSGTGSEGGGSRQTPTLPVVTNMASDAVF